MLRERYGISDRTVNRWLAADEIEQRDRERMNNASGTAA
jgi:hypothetical protein